MTADTGQAAGETVLAWRETGRRDGAPLVLLHGFGGSGHSFDTITEDLGAHARIILPDLPGHGASAGVGGSRHPRAAAKAVLATLDRIGCDTFHLGGFSMGGAVACLIAMMAPERLRSLTLLAPGGFGTEIAAAALRDFAAARGEAELRDALGAMFAPGAEIADAEVEVLERERRDPAIAAELPAIAEMITPEGRQGEIPRAGMAAITCPVRIVWGTADPVLPVEQSRDLPPGFQLTLVDGAGHMLTHEAREAVLAALTEAICDDDTR